MNDTRAVLRRWAECRCCCTRAPTDPCRCVWDGKRRACDRPVSLQCDQVTAKDRTENRNLKKQGDS